MKKLLIANWKMNIDCKRGVILAKEIIKQLKSDTKKDFVLLPSIQSIYYIKNKIIINF